MANICTELEYFQCAVQLTCVQDPFDDSGHLPLQHGVEQLDNEDETGTEHQQRQSQQDQTYCQIRQIHIHKEMETCRHTEVMAVVLNSMETDDGM